MGGATPLLLVASWWLRRVAEVDIDAAEYAVGATMFYAAHVINDPHFSVTYLLFYEDARKRAFGDAFGRALRVRYWLAGALAPVVLVAWALRAILTGSPELLGALVQLMFLLVGWHYVKQGFGVALTLAARRGVRFSAPERRALLGHCLAGWAYAWASPAVPVRSSHMKGVGFTSLARPAWLEQLALAAFVASGLWLLRTLLRKYRREGRTPLGTPLLALLSSVWAWSVFADSDPLVRYMVPALHSLQYLYFVWLLKRAETLERQQPPWLQAPSATRLTTWAVSALALGWCLFDGLPEGLDGWFAAAPRASGGEAAAGGASLGATPYFAGLFACVNIHHYFMDSVIWRRDNPRTRYLSGQAPGPG